MTWNLTLAFAKKHNIKFYFSEANDIIKNSIVERFNRTLANLINKYRIHSKSYDWPKYLPTLVQNYNNTYHSTIKATPLDVFEGNDTNKQKVIEVPNLFKAGDKVRIVRHKSAFDKGDIQTYSKETYTVEEIEGNKIYLFGIDRSYQPHQLRQVGDVKVGMTDDDAEVEHEELQQARKQERILKQVGIVQSNIVEGKRERKAKKVFDL